MDSEISTKSENSKDSYLKAERTEKPETVRDSEADGDCDVVSIESDHIEDNVFDEINTELDLSRHLQRIKVILNEVRESVVKKIEGSRGRIQITRAEQSKILNGVHAVQNEIIALISEQQKTLLNVYNRHAVRGGN